MRIGLIHYSFWPVVGGVETIVHEHARLFAEAGHEVTVFCRDTRGPASPKGSEAVAPAFRFSVARYPPADAPWESSEGSFQSRREVLRAFLEPRLACLDVVFAHNVATMPFDLPLTAMLWRAADDLPATRFIAWVHDLAVANPDYAVPEAGALPWDLLRRAHPNIGYVAVSELRHRQFTEVAGVPQVHCAVVPNGVDLAGHLRLTPEVSRLANCRGLFENDLVLLHPTRLLRRKNVETSLRVTAALRTQGWDAVLLVTGAEDPHNPDSHDYAEALRALRAELKLEAHALFLADELDLGPETLSSLYRVADALFLPSREEGFGLPMLEAALQRIPAFCTDREPMNRLPGAIPFHPQAPPEEIAALIMRRIKASRTIQARKKVAREFAWPVVWRNFLAPLLNAHETPRIP